MAEHDDAFRAHLGEFMMTHQLHESSVAPFFVIWALTMVVARIAIVLVRARRLPAVATAQPVTVAA